MTFTSPLIITDSDRSRFLSKVALPDEDGHCLWMDTPSSNGYGQIRIGGRAGQMRKAHRVAWTIFVGPIPEGLEIDHRCRVRLCQTPDHLRPATTKQNMENTGGAYSNSASGIRGAHRWVSSSGRIRWRAVVSHHGRSIHLGSFDTAKAAGEIAAEARRKLFTYNDEDYREVQP